MSVRYIIICNMNAYGYACILIRKCAIRARLSFESRLSTKSTRPQWTIDNWDSCHHRNSVCPLNQDADHLISDLGSLGSRFTRRVLCLPEVVRFAKHQIAQINCEIIIYYINVESVQNLQTLTYASATNRTPKWTILVRSTILANSYNCKQ